jgi:hypothetical protein
MSEENGRSNIFKASSNSHKLLDSYGFTDQGREWAAELDERITEKDNNKKRLEGKIPIIKIDSNPITRMSKWEKDDVSDAEIKDDGKPLPKRKRRR